MGGQSLQVSLNLVKINCCRTDIGLACIVCSRRPSLQLEFQLINPVHELGKIVKQAVQKQGMLGWQFNTVGVSDASKWACRVSRI